MDGKVPATLTYILRSASGQLESAASRLAELESGNDKVVDHVPKRESEQVKWNARVMPFKEQFGELQADEESTRTALVTLGPVYGKLNIELIPQWTNVKRLLATLAGKADFVGFLKSCMAVKQVSFDRDRTGFGTRPV